MKKRVICHSFDSSFTFVNQKRNWRKTFGGIEIAVFILLMYMWLTILIPGILHSIRYSVHYKMITTISLVTVCIIKIYYSIIDYFPLVVHSISVTYLFYNWKFVSLRASLVAQMLKRLPAMREIWVWSLGLEDPLEKEMATHSSILAWRIPWTDEPGGLQSTGSQSRIWLSDFTFTLTFVSLNPFHQFCSSPPTSLKELIFKRRNLISLYPRYVIFKILLITEIRSYTE